MSKAATLKDFNLLGLINMKAFKTTPNTVVNLDKDGNATVFEMDNVMSVDEFIENCAATEKKHDGDDVFMPVGVVSVLLDAGRIDDEMLEKDIEIGTPFTAKDKPGLTLVKISKKASVASIRDRLKAGNGKAAVATAQAEY